MFIKRKSLTSPVPISTGDSDLKIKEVKNVEKKEGYKSN